MHDAFGKILVMDADATQALLVTAWLQVRGFTVATHNGGSGWREALAGGYEAVICDDELPQVPPESLLDAWQEINPHGFVIFLGRQLRPERMLELMNKGAYTYLAKPVMEERLVQALSQGRQNRQIMLGILELSEELTMAYRRLHQQAELLQKKHAKQVEQAAELDFINKFNYSMTTTLDPEKLAGIIAQELGRQVSFSFFGLDWFPKGGERQIFIAPGIDVKGQQAFLEQYPGGDATVAGGVEKRAAFYFVGGEERLASRSELPVFQRTVPLEMGGKKVGRVILGGDEPLELPLATLKLLRGLGPYMVLAMKNAMEHHRLRNLAENDALTQVLNRRMFDYHLKREVITSQRYDYPVSLMLVDVDQFKEINDTHGHLVGDMVLKRIAGLLQEESRQSDLLARFGGDEFVLILPHTTGKKARVMAKRFVKRLNQERFANGAHLKVTVSIGIANNQVSKIMDENDLVFEADRALYQAKERGRNNLVVIDKAKVSGKRLTLAQDERPQHHLKMSTPV